ncbi:uncharacterized protein M6B38_189885 [Iris pallida]|uniref:Uncharacterized protein n=1 Tax=Iris pallida TaxID=29817 RepID=A0AAX6EIH6_IRIPA|nr:uncharacterized protein M6B38_189885 [Iris pallida]
MQSSSSSSLWRKVAILKNPLISSSSQFAPFHSTPISLAKRSAKWNFKDQGRGQKPSKDDNLNWSADEAARRNTKSKSSLHDSDNFSRSHARGILSPTLRQTLEKAIAGANVGNNVCMMQMMIGSSQSLKLHLEDRDVIPGLSRGKKSLILTILQQQDLTGGLNQRVKKLRKEYGVKVMLKTSRLT